MSDPSTPRPLPGSQESSPSFSLVQQPSPESPPDDWSSEIASDDIDDMSDVPDAGSVPSSVGGPAPDEFTPRLGGVHQTSPSDTVAWTGGKPKPDWSGLDPSAPTGPLSPGQYRVSSVSSSQKSRYYRTRGLEDKLKPGGDLSDFEHAIWTHLVDYGMDTVTYVPDPLDPANNTISCVKDHARLSKQLVDDGIQPQVAAYDSFDRVNDREATTFLLASVDAELAKELRSLRDEDDPFPVVYMYLIGIVRSSSIDRFNDIKERIKGRRPAQFAGEDIAALASAYRADAQELVAGGQYDHNLTLNMLSAFLEGGGKDQGIDINMYRFSLLALHKQLQAKLLEVSFMSSADRDQAMSRDGLSYKTVCETATTEYRTLLHQGKWPPARNNPDAKRAPAAFGGLACSEVGTPVTQAQLNVLIQQAVQDATKPKMGGNCHNCGKPGHWSRECPEKKSGGPPRNFRGGRGGRFQGGRPQGGRGGGGDRGNRGFRDGFDKRKGPGPGESKTKVVNGKTWHWCEKCGGRWSTTHGTSSHSGPDRSSGGGGGGVQANALVGLHSAWALPLNLDPTFSDLLSVIGILLEPAAVPFLCFLIGILTPFASVWSAVCHASVGLSFGFSVAIAHWQFTLAIVHWICLLGWTFGLYRGSRTAQTCIAERDPPPPCPRWAKRSGPKFAKRRRRLFRANSPAHQRFDKLLSDSLPKPAPRRDRALRRMHKAAEQDNFRDLSSLLHHVVNMEKSIQFQRLHSPRFEEGESPEALRTSRKRHACRRTPKLSACYRPVGNDGLTRAQLRALNSPVVMAMVCESEMPTRLKNLAHALRAAFTDPQSTRTEIGKDRHYDVIWDSGASISISFCRADFVGPIEDVSYGTKLVGIAKGLKVAGKGHVAWSFVDSTGMLRTLKVPALYVPGANVRLLSTTDLMKQYPDETLVMQDKRLVLSGVKGSSPLRRPIEILFDPSTNLPIGFAYSQDVGPVVSQAFNSVLSTVSSHNHNLSPAEKELLRWHYRLGHLDFKKIQFLMRTGVLASSESARRLQSAASKLSKRPLCAGCQYGKQRRLPSPGTKRTVVRDREGALKHDNLFPGQRVSVDHFVCSTRGRLPNTRGKEDEKLQYTGGAIFVDHASGYVFVNHQVHLNTHETLQSKAAFEQQCRDYGVVPQSYLSDNAAIFTSEEYQAHLQSFRQISQFAGVGAHHHNGIAERNIQTIMSIARTMMLHSAIHWCDVADPRLWPFAVSHAAHLFNHMPSPETGLSPHDLFSKTRWPHAKFQDHHVWGCPVYVLDKTIADGKKVPRWKPRSNRQVFVGLSPSHASSVPLVLNLDTGAVTPQFHVVFDDWFATVASDPASLPDFGSPEWEQMFGDSAYQYVVDEADSEPVDDSGANRHISRSLEVSAAMDSVAPSVPLPVTPPPTQQRELGSNTPAPAPAAQPTPVQTGPVVPNPVDGTPFPAPFTRDISDAFVQSPLEREPTPVPVSLPQASVPSVESSSRRQSIQREKTPATPAQDRKSAPKPAPETIPAPPRRSTRTKTTPNRLGFDGTQGRGYLSVDCDVSPTAEPSQPYGLSNSPEFMMSSAYFVHFDKVCSDHLRDVSPVAFAARRAVKDPDLLTFDEAMSDPDREKWMEAAQIEIDALNREGTWVEVPMSEAKSKIIPQTWAFKRKRTPDGEVKKHKARTCVRGDLEEPSGNPDDNFSPVVSWSSVRMFLILSTILGWKTISIDYSSAFVQARLKEPVWVHLPRGFKSSKGPNTCLRLEKSLYGLSIAPRLWFEHILKALLELGFKQTTQDPCFLYKDGIMLILYVDDQGVSVRRPEDLKWFVSAMREKGFTLTEEGSFAEFLGIKFEQVDENEFRLTQKGLIDKIVKATGLGECRPNILPASQMALGSDKDGPDMDEEWHYSSIVGMLLYLSTNSRPDIALAVSQVCRFSANPKQSHATAVKSIVRYLHRTRNEGMLLRPSGRLDLDLYVDADFCSLHGQEADHDPNSARSRTGYIICLSECPIIWKSVLQTHISLSTLEAEYSALSFALKTLLPLKRLLLELVESLDIDEEIRTSVRARAFEDNQGALCLATNHRVTSRTKYFSTKWHWFWDHDDEFEAIKVDTKLQRADYFTKALSRELFESNRRQVQGW